ncbi:hypothetical protein GALMADRAFT_245096 [Galerina marginata CBS 339.88]|uniref:Pheromone n=1 Tax=Galerina marginata (strain CBS 339.88) TaxID=685588 RepID=A0A067TGI7_GALM3|nr:hypothetical protein GALMADRAFT_245096 [Galerina marginata CBS 339.88]
MDSFGSVDFLAFLGGDASSSGANVALSQSSSSSIPISLASHDECEMPADYEVRNGGGPSWFCVIA